MVRGVHLLAIILGAHGLTLEPAKDTKKQRHQALIEQKAAHEAELANTYVNEISTHEWSMEARNFGAPKDVLKQEPKIETWYINTDKATDRNQCIEKQLKKAGYSPLRFAAIDIPHDWEQSTNEDVVDCLRNGVHDMPGLTSAERQRVISDWCSHKRLFEALSAAPSTADYFLVLEDTPVLKTDTLKATTEDLAANLNHRWSMIQLDPYGGIATPVDFHQGRPIFKPSTDFHAQGAYKGSHALLLKKSALEEINGWMKRSKATKLDEAIRHFPDLVAVSTGAAVNPRVNMFQERLELPSYCKAEDKKQNSLMEAEATTEEDLWALWQRQEQKSGKRAWFVPAAKKWISFSEETRNEKIVQDASKKVEVWQMGASDEDPARSSCFSSQLKEAGLASKRFQLLEIPTQCGMQPDGSNYNNCLAQHGLDECSVAGELSLSAFGPHPHSTDRVQIRDHAVSSTCSFKKLLSKIATTPETSPYVLIVNENAVIDKETAKQKLWNFIENHQDKSWSAVQIDSYGREAPVEQDLQQGDLSDDQAKSRFWGSQAVLVKRKAIPQLIQQMEQAQKQKQSIGPADRIPRITKGWVAANLGLAYDPHMGDVMSMDHCGETPSRAEHFKIRRQQIPEEWGAQPVAQLMKAPASLAQKAPQARSKLFKSLR